MNFAGIGFTYDKTRDTFIPPQPYESWVLDESTCQWKSPVEPPSNNVPYMWNEETKTWIND